MFPSDYDYKQHVWKNMFVVITTVDFPENTERVKVLQKQLLDAGFCSAYVFMGKKAENKSKRINVIFEAHRDICDWFDQSQIAQHLFILEDDADICDKKASMKTIRYVRKLDRLDPKWGVLSLGCLALTAVDTVSDQLHRGAGVGSHAYVLNGRQLSLLLGKIPKDKWVCPYAVEVWSKIPPEHVYMIHPMLFSQIMHIWSFIPGFGNAKFWYKYVNVFNSINNWRNYLLVLLLIIYELMRRNNKRGAQIALTLTVIMVIVPIINFVYLKLRERKLLSVN